MLIQITFKTKEYDQTKEQRKQKDYEYCYVTTFAADESRWIRSPSSALNIHEKLGAKSSYAKRFI